MARSLHSLSCAKFKILLKEPASRQISQTDTFRLNTKFSDRMQRIRVAHEFPALHVVRDVDFLGVREGSIHTVWGQQPCAQNANQATTVRGTCSARWLH